MNQEQVARALFVADNWRNLYAGDEWDEALSEDEKHPYHRMGDAILPLIAAAKAEALREAAEYVSLPGRPHPMAAEIIQWLRTRATHLEGRALVNGIIERKAQG